MKVVAILVLGLFAGALAAPALPVKRRSTETLTDSDASQMLADLQKANANNAEIADDGISSVFDEAQFDVLREDAKETNSEEILRKTALTSDAEVNNNDDSFSAFMDDGQHNGNAEFEAFLESGIAALNGDGVPVINKPEAELTEEELEKLANGELALSHQQGDEDMDEQFALYGEANAHTVSRRSADDAQADQDYNSDMYDFAHDGISTLFDEQNFAVGKMAAAEMDHNEEVSVFTSALQGEVNGDGEDSFSDFMADNVNNGNDEFAELEEKGAEIMDGDSDNTGAMPGSELSQEELSQLVNTELADANKLVSGHSEETEIVEEGVQAAGTKEAVFGHADANSAQVAKEEDNDVSYLDELAAASNDDDGNKAEAAEESSASSMAVSQRRATSDREELQQLRQQSERSAAEGEDAAAPPPGLHEKDRDQAMAAEEAKETVEHDTMMDSKLDRLLELQLQGLSHK